MSAYDDESALLAKHSRRIARVTTTLNTILRVVTFLTQLVARTICR
jgi:hypothetical protein